MHRNPTYMRGSRIPQTWKVQLQKGKMKYIQLTLVKCGSWGTNPQTVENWCVTLQLALCIHGSTFMDSNNCGSGHTVVCVYWKKCLYKWTHTVQTCVAQESTIYHAKLRNEIGAWGFQGQEGYSQQKESRCLVMRGLPCHIDGTT